MAGKIDFKKINQVALSQLAQLVAEWVPGGVRSGREYSCLNPMRADSRRGSFSINVLSGCWFDFSTGDGGSDPVSLYAYLFLNNDQGAAAKELAAVLGLDSGVAVVQRSAPVKAEAEKKPSNTTFWVPGVPEAELEKPLFHSVRGLPSAIYTYRDEQGKLLGYVYRFVTSDGGKEVVPLTWCKHERSKKSEWRFMQWAEPRPLYGLDRLALFADHAPVLIVEGEKCADAGQAALSDRPVLCWSGGGKVPHKADWSPIAGRDVIIWPDCDSKRYPQRNEFAGELMSLGEQPGMVTAIKIAQLLSAQGCTVWLMAVPMPGEKKDGWDIADCVAEGCTGEALATFIEAQAMPFRQAVKADLPLAPASAGGGDTAGVALVDTGTGDMPPDPPDIDDDQPGQKPWWSDDLIKKSNGAYEPCMTNVAKILRFHPLLKDCARFNEFSYAFERHGVPWNPVPGDWEDRDDLMLNEWLVDNLNLIIKNQGTIKDAVSLAAHYHHYHPVRDYLLSLPAWDGVDRLDFWLAEIVQAERKEFLILAGRFFLMGMVKRIFSPGCKFDYMLVLEGAQGMGKSSLFRALADPWFSETAFDVNTNEGNMAIQGVWLHEMAEMGQFSKAEDRDFKQFLTVVQDKFRRPYDKRHVTSPRVCLFGGTTNLDQYLKDMTGNRRIWPVRCDEVCLEWLTEHKEQLFAEAIQRVNAGERYWPTREEEKLYFEPEQEARKLDDQWIELLDAYVNEMSRRTYNWFPTNHLLIKACGIERQKIDPHGAAAQRLGRVMLALGWRNCKESTPRGGMLRRKGFQRPLLQRVLKDDVNQFSTPDDNTYV
ncbi:VapE domain-containing protein [Methylomonas sp. AM2-LC]|uniref:VapE domain-containing protein n=1 Tax=Methylomonas sp. AM2-LC TaxID=3153301 RepID=UPI0032662406